MSVQRRDFLELAISKDDIQSSTQFFEQDHEQPKVKKLIDYFYSNHPVKGLVRNRAQDTLTIKRMLEYCDFQQILQTIKYMHAHRKCDLKHIQLVVNEAVQYQQYIESREIVDTAANLVDYFYSLYDNQFDSPNFLKECVQLDSNLDKYSATDIRKVLKLMVAKRNTDLRMFNYIRNEYLSKKRDEVAEFRGVVEFE